MSEPQAIQATNNEPEPEADTDQEFHAIHTDAIQSRERFELLAKEAEAAGKPEIAAVYREVSSEVLGLIAEMAMSTAGAIIAVEDAVDGLEDTVDALPGGGAPDDSSLLKEDADKYLSLFDQYLRLLEGLSNIVPKGSDGDEQRKIFATLKRLTEGMIEFTKSISPETDDETETEDPEDDDE